MGRATRLTLLMSLSVGASIAVAQATGGAYTMRRQVVAGGGSRASDGAYVATVTIAEPVASPAQSGGAYRLTGGFHGQRAAAVSLPETIFCDGFESAPCP